jgi:hypothetical protein
VLANAQSGREVVQDFCSLAESLEMELGKEHLFQRGNKAFISGAPTSVPYIINNDGNLSRSAAGVFFESLETSACRSRLRFCSAYQAETGPKRYRRDIAMVLQRCVFPVSSLIMEGGRWPRQRKSCEPVFFA